MDKIFERLSPLFQAGLEAIQDDFPAAREGDLAARQLIISFYGMIVTYFNMGPLLGRLMGTDPLSKRNISMRKKHLHRMLDILAEELDGGQE